MTAGKRVLVCGGPVLLLGRAGIPVRPFDHVLLIAMQRRAASITLDKAA